MLLGVSFNGSTDLHIRVLIADKLARYWSQFDEFWTSIPRCIVGRWRQLSQKAGTRCGISISRDLVLPSVERRVRLTSRHVRAVTSPSVDLNP